MHPIRSGIFASGILVLAAASARGEAPAEPRPIQYLIHMQIRQRSYDPAVTEVTSRTLTDDEAAKERDSKDPKISTLSRPQVMTLDGTEAMVQIGGGRIFVVGYDDGEPQQEQAHEGLTVALVPHTIDAKRVRLELNYQSSRVAGVRKTEVAGAGNNQQIFVERPLFQRTQLDADLEMRLGQTTQVRGIVDRDHEGRVCETEILLRAERF